MFTKQCPTCRQEFHAKYPSLTVLQTYCSRRCVPFHDLMRTRGKIEKVCSGCSTPFFVSHCRRFQKACSIKCRTRLRLHAERASLQERACIVCGTSFLIAKAGKRFSRHAGSASKQFCSRTCRVQSHYIPGAKCLPLSAEESSYMAGFWDGEGSIMLIGRPPAHSFGLRVTATNTCHDVLAWIRDKCNIGTVQAKPRMAAHHKQGWTWQIHGEGAETFLQQLLPYLRVKREQARLALAFQARLRDPSMKADRVWQEEWRQQMKALNARGVLNPDRVITKSL